MNYILVAIFLWCNVSSLHCIFGVMYMHFWYAMHRQLCWCLVGVITIVQCIFGALFLGLGCNIFLVLRLWCYALSAISRRLATAVAHLLYNIMGRVGCVILNQMLGQDERTGTVNWDIQLHTEFFTLKSCGH